MWAKLAIFFRKKPRTIQDFSNQSFFLRFGKKNMEKKPFKILLSSPNIWCNGMSSAIFSFYPVDIKTIHLNIGIAP